MSSLFADAMGTDFGRLHPQLQRRFGVSSDTEHCVGQGTMDRIWRGAPFTVPFLWVGAWRNILVPTTGEDVPFTIENYAYVDTLGRETVTFNRTFELPGHRRARFDATMVHSPERGRVLDYLGTHQHLAVDIELAVDARGGMRLRSGAQRFYEGPVAFTFPMFFSGVADVCEWYDDDAGQYRISVDVRNRRWGRLFGYRGAFDVQWLPMRPDQIPAHVRPVREERRE